VSKQFLRMYRSEDVSQEMGTPIRYTIATEGIKRDGLNLKVAGARVDNYLRNPIVTWVHDFMGQRLPIGRAALIIGADSIDAEITFDQEDEFARQVESKYRRGYLNAVSVSWNPLQMNGRDVDEWEFLELAAVPVPGDPDALIKRQYEALGELLGETSLPASPLEGRGAEGAEGLWEELAAEMVDVFLRGSDESGSREGRYRALLPRYRKLGKVAPEFIDDEGLRGLGSAELRGLFLEGEWGLVFPEEPTPRPSLKGGEKRKGAVLSKRNLDDLGRAVELVSGVIERARKEDSTAEEEAGKDTRPTDEEEESRAAFEGLNQFLDRLNKLEV